ncbi:DUF1918 domain-containing protein [Pseudarthrobacter sp. J75]|uniref:DUF1918 domain-containing protein n=1 Tax=unclassified Pseudarthrobacter TaxID=2647000 RepID=UPI002E8231D2|nr:MULTISPECIES: DUF1918 domain-containing protein [unclassified Pseudarthrobacter]MEE2522603.1 DUF1918 domain-containing protein [Pseudarthrobacter sp. J47]MEE2529052.1 DUF1918 domain-containing protein [Pseudarthrobacter sp. J75]MEE2571022.1 DUF1918 domain-containing protein [Pseudarthrobacter sp. J64]
MKAAQGDRIIVRGRTVETSDRHGEIVEVKGADGSPPYTVKFDDGHESIVFPGGDFVVEKPHQP